MSRIARIKSPEFIYHVMCRSMSEFNLFRDSDDKQYYLILLKKYCEKNHCSIYAYCLMDTHVHLHLDPQGFDISKFMQCVNLSYALYYNNKHKRRGPVFQNRFESRVVSSDGYNLALSAYIHLNPKDVEGYKGREFEYPFSSMGIYLGTRKDTLKLVNTGFVLGLFNSGNKMDAIKFYSEFVFKQKDLATDKSIDKCLKRFANNEYKSERLILYRHYKPEELVSFISEKLGFNSSNYIKLSSNREAGTLRAFSTFIIRSLCGFSYKEICRNIGNITMSGVSRLCRKGFELYKERDEFKTIFNEILKLPQTV
jgi:putative transposase